MNDLIEWHYAPLAGTLAKKKDGKFEPVPNWTVHHENMAEFLKLCSDGKLKLKETINYGHPHFHGHSGRVDIYT